MRRALLLTAALTCSLTACGSSGGTTASSTASTAAPTAQATALASTGTTGTCKPSGTGTTELATKPVYTVTKAAPPAETTVTDIVCGTGAEATDGSAVEVKYVGVGYTDGKEFDSSWSRGDTLPFTIGSGVITGFSKGVTGMRVGGRRQVVIPPKDGYGDGGPVPGGTLVFLIDLVKVG